MSTNAKNTIRPEFLKNFTTKVKDRYILLEKGNPQFKDISSLVGSINQTVNQIIQELNLKIVDRQLPYITLKTCYGNVADKRVRVFLHNDDTDFLYECDIQTQIEDEREISHILDLLVAASLKKITISSLSCDAELIIDYKLLKAAIIDILLDIVMFNSYSFLKRMNIADKKKFSQEKYLFFKNEQLYCFYDCPTDKMMYYSLSFSARFGEDDFNIDDYINYWNRFINQYYPNNEHIEKSIKEQIKQHVDFEELRKDIPQMFDELPKGAYLLLRTNKDRTEDLHPMLYSLFGIKRYRKGRIKIVPIEDFDKYRVLMEHLDISAYKIVK
ncbi:MAG: hypothetical protein HFG28_03240 [Eubacterium sp.]|nr:hypothetical protein [Eubacterium sp.]